MLSRLCRLGTVRTIAVLVAMLTGGVALAACASGPPSTPSASAGLVIDRKLPAVPLVGEDGQPTSLAAFEGKTVLLATTLTLCQEMCPLTNGNLLQVQRAIDAAGLSKKVQIVEYTVDPERDTPARLQAYKQLTGISWPILTGTQANIDALNSFFHFFAEKVPEGSPPGIDWWTHQPLTYDVNHSDGYVLINSTGHERFVTAAAPKVPSHHLPKALEGLLDDEGKRNLNDPTGQTWTVPQALSALGWLVGQTIPAPS